MDLRSWDFETDGPVELRGEWEFYWKQLLQPDRGPSPEKTPRRYKAVPELWEQGSGFATYRLTLRLPAKAGPLSIFLREQSTAWQVYANNQLIASVGRVGTTAQDSLPKYLPFARSLPQANDSQVVIQTLISNFHSRVGGFSKPVLIGTEQQIIAAVNQARMIEAFLVGVLLIMGLYHLVIWYARRKETSALWFGVFCIVIVARLLVTGEQLLHLALPGAPWVLLYKIEYLSYYGAVGIIVLFMASLFPDEFHRHAVIGNSAVASLSLLFVLFFPTPFFTISLIPFEIYTVLAGGYVLFAVGRAVKRRRTGAKMILAAFLILFAGVVNDILYATILFGFGYVFPITMFLFIFAQSAAISRRIAVAFNTSEDLSAHLEQKVEHRTAALEQAKSDSDILADLARQINSAEAIDTLLDVVAGEVLRRFGAESSSLVTVDPQQACLRTVAYYIKGKRGDQSLLPAVLREMPLARESGAPFRAYQKRRPFHLSRINQSWLQASPVDRAAVDMGNLKWLLSLPLLVEDSVVGVLSFAGPRARHLSRAELTFCERLAAQVAGAVRTSELLRQTEAARLEAQKLALVSKRLNETSTLDEIVADVVEFVRSDFDVDGIILLLVDKRTRTLRPVRNAAPAHVADETITKIQDDLCVPLDSASILAKVVKRGRSLYQRRIVWSEQTFPTDREIIEQLGIHAYLAVPLVVRGESMGLILLANFGSKLSLTRRMQTQIERYCDQIAGGILTAELLEQTESARRDSDKLLANILPPKVAEELKREGSVEPLFYDSVSVLFTDFVGFTAASQKMMPDELVSELDGCFSQFDEVARRNSLEKLKTIGDSYMCAAGLPTLSPTHAIDACLAALEFRAFMAQMAEVKKALGHEYWQIRIGIHSGPVTAGVIGTNKFAYDIWGDTVNTASRMESSGVPGEVNISADTYLLVRDFFECESRGFVQAKGKGQLEMFFLRRILPELSSDEDGLVPNEVFGKMHRQVADPYGDSGVVAREGQVLPGARDLHKVREDW